jgi:hypothetical protein
MIYQYQEATMKENERIEIDYMKINLLHKVKYQPMVSVYLEITRRIQ